MKNPEANAALCRELRLAPRIAFEDGKMYADCERYETYPDLTSADVLMAALRKGKHYYSLNPDHAEICTFPGMGQRRFQSAFGMSMGDALFRAACAAFGIEVGE